MKMIQKVQKVFQRILVATLVFIFALSQAMTQEVSATTAQRNSAISAMTSLRSISWYPNGSVSIAGTQYAIGGAITGIPYNQSDLANTTLSGFLSNPNMQYVTSGGNFYLFSQPTNEVGNDCSSAVAISWSAGGSSINVAAINTAQMLSSVKSASCCMAKRGTYSTSTNVGDPLYYTYAMAHSVSKVTLYNALVPGDACFYKTSSEGHAILITGVNTASQTVTYIEQIGPGSSRLTSTHSTWTSGTMSYTQLYNAGYVPVRCTDI